MGKINIVHIFIVIKQTNKKCHQYFKHRKKHSLNKKNSSYIIYSKKIKQFSKYFEKYIYILQLKDKKMTIKV